MNPRDTPHALPAADLLAAGGLVLGAALLGAGLVRLLWPLLARYAMARPNARSSHRAPTPQGGGAAVLIAAAAGLAAAGAWAGAWGFAPGGGEAPGGPEWAWAARAMAAALGLGAVGALDDLRPLPALPRLALQLLAVAAVVLGLPEAARVFPWMPLGAERALAVLAGLWLVNLTNFMDGIDGITLADLLPPLAALALLAAWGHASPAAGALALALGGALLGFLPFNRPPARLFLGDVGSLPLGLLLGAGLLDLSVRAGPVPALILPLYPLADATLTLLRRIARRERVWEAHRGHAYQRAVDAGMGVRAVLGRVLATNLALAALALLAAGAAPAVQAAALAAAALVVAALLAALGRPAARAAGPSA